MASLFVDRGKPKRDGELQRLRNVAQKASVGALLDHYDSNWQRLWWLRIDREAAVESVLPVLMTRHLRFVDESTRRLMGAISDVQAARVKELVTAAGQRFGYKSFPAMGAT